MNIKIVDSWLREFLETKASAKEIAQQLSLTSVSVEKLEKVDNDFVYDIEVTTNRVDLMSVTGIAKEAAASLNQIGISAEFVEKNGFKIQASRDNFPLKIDIDPSLVYRICAVVLEVEIGKSPEHISKRLELSGIRSLNNLVDVTNYVMRETGNPSHVFDYDLLSTKKLVIRRSRNGEKIETLDGKVYTLPGGDIVADDGTGKIVDLLGIMGTKNSVVRETTKRILFFLDNNNPTLIRKTSMALGIRSEAAIINEKGIDPQSMEKTLDQGIQLYKKIAKGKIISPILDIYTQKSKQNKVKVSFEKIKDTIGIEIKPEECIKIMQQLGFNAKKVTENLEVEIPTHRPDVTIEEDVIEEIARIYGYQKLPSIIPTFLSSKQVPFANNFYFETRIKNALKYYGFTEVYTNSLVSEELYQGPIEEALKISNPLSNELLYLRNSLIPSLLAISSENKTREELKIFEISNIYLKRENDLPKEISMLSAVIKKPHINFYKTKGLIEQLLADLGISGLRFKKSTKSATGASVYKDDLFLGEIEILDYNLIDFELNFEKILSLSSVKKTFKAFAKFPPILEDISIITNAQTQEIINIINAQSNLIADAYLHDSYQDSRTFRIIYQDFEKNLTNKDIALVRERIINTLREKLKAEIKE